MKIEYSIAYVSMIIWLLPLLKQRKTEYFYYFYILAIADAIKLPLKYYFNIPYSPVSLFFAFLLLAALVKDKNFRVGLIIAAIIFAPVASYLNMPSIYFNSFVILIHIVVIIIIISYLSFYLLHNKVLNLFLVILLVYETIMVLKRIAVLIDPQIGVITFMLGFLFQIFFGLLFVFININTKNFTVIKD